MSQKKIEFISYIEILGKHRRFILLITALFFFLSIGVSLYLPKSYKSTAMFIPPSRKNSSMVSLLGQFSGGGALGDFFSGDNEGPELYVKLLETETIKDQIINKFNLFKTEQAETREQLYKFLDKITTVEAARRTGIVTVSVEDFDPVRSADMTNAYLDALGELLNSLNAGSAAQERKFLENRLANEMITLAEAEDNLMKFQSQNKTIDVNEQGRAVVDAIVKLRADLATQEMKLASLGQSMTSSNPEVQNVRIAIKELQRQIGELEGNNGKADGAIPTVEAIPALGKEYERLLRDLKVREAVVEMLTRQYEVARINELKDVTGLKIVQSARIPEIKYKPHRFKIVILTTYIGVMLGFLGAFALERFSYLSTESRNRWRRAVLHLVGR